jgi:hypothetical protein
VDPYHMFFWGMLGSAAVEIATLWAYAGAGRALPKRYRKTAFWIVRALLTVVAGAIAVAYGLEKAIVCIHVGAATPIILQKFAEAIPQKV